MSNNFKPFTVSHLEAGPPRVYALTEIVYQGDVPAPPDAAAIRASLESSDPAHILSDEGLVHAWVKAKLMLYHELTWTSHQVGLHALLKEDLEELSTDHELYPLYYSIDTLFDRKSPQPFKRCTVKFPEVVYVVLSPDEACVLDTAFGVLDPDAFEALKNQLIYNFLRWKLRIEWEVD